MKLAKSSQNPPMKELAFVRQPPATPVFLKRSSILDNSIGERDAVDMKKKKLNERKKVSAGDESKKGILATPSNFNRKSFLEQIQEKKTQLKNVSHLDKDSKLASEKINNNPKMNNEGEFASDSSYESDTYVDLWINTPNMRGGRKLPDRTK